MNDHERVLKQRLSEWKTKKRPLQATAASKGGPVGLPQERKGLGAAWVPPPPPAQPLLGASPVPLGSSSRSTPRSKSKRPDVQGPFSLTQGKGVLSARKATNNENAHPNNNANGNNSGSKLGRNDITSPICTSTRFEAVKVSTSPVPLAPLATEEEEEEQAVAVCLKCSIGEQTQKGLTAQLRESEASTLRLQAQLEAVRLEVDDLSALCKAERQEAVSAQQQQLAQLQSSLEQDAAHRQSQAALQHQQQLNQQRQRADFAEAERAAHEQAAQAL